VLVLCYGIQKSGSTLAFEMVAAALKTAGFAQAFVRNDRDRKTRNFVAHITRDKIEELVREIGPDRRIAVKTHSGFPQALSPWLERLMAEGALRVIASYRDPRDVCLSLLDAGAKSRAAGVKDFAGIVTLDDAADYVERRLAVFARWAALNGTIALDYETVAFTPHDAIDAVEAALGIVSDREAVLRHAFGEAKTLKNKARPARHRDELSAEDHARLTARFGDFIDRCVRPCGP
jgi:glucuronate isomerase